ncbi:MAG: hypothetical protein V3R95_10235 [Dehalococcoidia bacterium]
MSTTLIDDNPGHRVALQRKLALNAPVAIGAWGVTFWLLLVLLGGNAGAIVGLTIIGIVTAAFSFESVAAFRDLKGEPTTTRGNVDRAWAKGRFLFIGTVRYAIVRGRVFELRPEAFASLQRDDTVEIRHWPRTNLVISIHLLTGEHATIERRPARR